MMVVCVWQQQQRCRFVCAKDPEIGDGGREAGRWENAHPAASLICERSEDLQHHKWRCVPGFWFQRMFKIAWDSVFCKEHEYEIIKFRKFWLYIDFLLAWVHLEYMRWKLQATRFICIIFGCGCAHMQYVTMIAHCKLPYKSANIYFYFYVNRLKPRFFMLAEAACCLVCPMMQIEKTRFPDFEFVIQ